MCSKHLPQICTDFPVPLHSILQWTLWEESSARNARLSNNFSVFLKECSSLFINAETIELTPLCIAVLRDVRTATDLHQLQQAENQHPALQSEIKCGGVDAQENFQDQICFLRIHDQAGDAQCNTTKQNSNYNSRISYPLDQRQTYHASCSTENCTLSSSDKQTGNGEEKLLVILINSLSIIKSIMRH